MSNEIIVERTYRNASKFQDKHLKEYFNELHETLFGRGVDCMFHTCGDWEEFFNYFLSLELVQEFDESTYKLKYIM